MRVFENNGICLVYISSSSNRVFEIILSQQAPLKMATLGQTISDRKKQMITLTELPVLNLTGLAKTTKK